MHLVSSNISCGIMELVDIGYNHYYEGYYSGGERSMRAAYDRIMVDLCAAMVIASVTCSQKAAITLLTKNGFKAVGKPKRNPNSGNSIILFVKRIGRN